MHSLQMELLMSHGLNAAQAAGVVEASFSPSSVHVDAPLSNFASTIRNRDMIADFVMPIVDVSKPSDKFFKYGADTFFEEQAAALTGAEAMPGRVRYTISTDNFSTFDYGLMDFVSNKEIEAADAPIDPQMHAVKVVTSRLDIAKQRRVAAIAFASGSYGSNTAALSGADRWDTNTSDPVQKIDDAIEACDERPNIMVIGAQAWMKLKNHPKLKETILSRSSTISGATPDRVTTDLVAALFELDAVYVGRAKYVSSREGQTSAKVVPTFAAVIGQVLLLDMVFSIDSVITAVGMTTYVWVMVIAIVVAVGIMFVASKAIYTFVNAHPSVKMLALAFLLLIGTILIAEGFGQKIPKGYIYAAMTFSVFVEVLNIGVRRKKPNTSLHLREPIVADSK